MPISDCAYKKTLSGNILLTFMYSLKLYSPKSKLTEQVA